VTNKTYLVPKDLVQKDFLWLVIVVCYFKFESHIKCVILTVEIFYVLIHPTSRAATPLDETRSNLKLSKKDDVVFAWVYIGMAQPSY